MLIGRFLMIVPALAIAGILAGKKSVPPGPGTLADERPALRRAAGRRHRDRRRADVLPRAQPGPDRRALPGAVRKGVLSHERQERPAPYPPGRAPSSRAALARRRAQARPAGDGAATRSCSWSRSGSVLTTLVWLRDVVVRPSGAAPAWFTGNVTLWLWFTVLFANFAEALAEGRGKAQAAALRGLRQETVARKLADGREERVPASHAAQGRRGRGRGGRDRSPATAR